MEAEHNYDVTTLNSHNTPFFTRGYRDRKTQISFSVLTLNTVEATTPHLVVVSNHKDCVCVCVWGEGSVHAQNDQVPFVAG